MTHHRNIQFTDFKNDNLDFLLDENKEPIYPVQYLMFGKEICPKTQKPHLQGYCEFTKKMYKKGIQTLFNSPIHIEEVKDRKALEKYNKKEGNFSSFGEPKSGSLWEQCKKLTNYEMIELNPDTADYFNVIRFMKESINDHKLEKNEKEFKQFYENITLNEIQINMKNWLKNQNDRQICWIWDPNGNKGKTWFANHIIATEDCLILTNGKTRDIATYYMGQKLIIFDFSRTSENGINYQVIEELKNGRVFAPKYKSNMKFSLRTKIICLANYPPNTSKLSKDRWDIKLIFEDLSFQDIHPDDVNDYIIEGSG